MPKTASQTPEGEDLDALVFAAIAEIEGRRGLNGGVRDFALEMVEANRDAGKRPGLKLGLARRRNIHDPDVSGDAAAVTINTRRALMESAKPRTFIVPEKGALICNGAEDIVIVLGEDGCRLPTLGKDFGYDPDRGEWVDGKN